MSSALAVSKTAVSGQLAIAVPGSDAIGDIYSYAAPSTLSGPSVLQVASSDSSEHCSRGSLPVGTCSRSATTWTRLAVELPTASATIATTSALIVDSNLYQGVQGSPSRPTAATWRRRRT